MLDNSNKTYYNVREVANLLNLSEISIRRYIKQSRIKGFYKLGKEWRIEKEDFESFLRKVKNVNK